MVISEQRVKVHTKSSIKDTHIISEKSIEPAHSTLCLLNLVQTGTDRSPSTELVGAEDEQGCKKCGSQLRS